MMNSAIVDWTSLGLLRVRVTLGRAGLRLLVLLVDQEKEEEEEEEEEEA